MSSSSSSSSSFDTAADKDVALLPLPQLMELLLQALILKPNGWRQRELLLVVAARDEGEESRRHRWLSLRGVTNDNAENDDVWTVWSDQASVAIIIIIAAAAMRVVHVERAEGGLIILLHCA